FFQVEDGIRDFHVTGVQTCALPICPKMAVTMSSRAETSRVIKIKTNRTIKTSLMTKPNRMTAMPPKRKAKPERFRTTRADRAARSEERRVGKAWREQRTSDEGREE